MNVRIVPALPQDAETLASLEAACFTDASSAETIRAYLTFGNCRYLIAYDSSDVPVGYCGVTVASDEADILNIAVLSSFRRQGIARSMMKKLLAAAGAMGARTVYLEVRGSAVPARALYRSLGFIEIGERKNYYSFPREDAVLMSFALPERADNES